jgi:hypothetical protein
VDLLDPPTASFWRYQGKRRPNDKPLSWSSTSAPRASSTPTGASAGVVYDEAWRLVSHPALLRRMDFHWRLARHYGIANMLIFHKLTDLDNAG